MGESLGDLITHAPSVFLLLLSCQVVPGLGTLGNLSGLRLVEILTENPSGHVDLLEQRPIPTGWGRVRNHRGEPELRL